MKSHLRVELGIENLLLMYVGNLEAYQGIDLLLESFNVTSEQTSEADLVIIGGEVSDIEKYQQKAQDLGISDRVHFLGPKPVEDLGFYLAQADILVSPRVKGKNTPMKLYSYLDSGKALVATDLPTHTQVLNPQISMLAQPTPEAFGEAMVNLMLNEQLRVQLGTAGKQLIEQKHTYAAFSQTLNGLYDWLQMDITPKVPTLSVS